MTESLRTTALGVLDCSPEWRPDDLADAWLAAQGRWVSGLVRGRDVLDLRAGTGLVVADLANTAR